MNAFETARMVEAAAMARLAPFLRERTDGQYIILDKGPLAAALQLTTGDMIVRTVEGAVASIEFKVEKRWTGNLFLEEWSNRNLNDRGSHTARGSKPGWMVHLGADFLFYYFDDVDRLYVFNFFALKRWAFGFNDNGRLIEGNIHRYPLCQQSKYIQLNDTLGRIVPIADLERDVGFKLFHPREYEQPEFLPF